MIRAKVPCLRPTAASGFAETTKLKTAHLMNPAPSASRSTIFALILACLAAAGQTARAQEGLDLLEQQAFQAAAERVAPSVVRIETVGGLQRLGRVLLGTGPTTGLVVEADGYIVSSAPAFLNRPDSILVQLPDGTRKPAELIATDHSRMLVLLKIEVDEPLPVPEMVPQAEIRVGQWAVGVGRIFPGNRPNVSVGIVSATNRVWGKAIQTDAAVSPNNYGGPLVDVRGRVLGVLVPLSPHHADQIAGVQWYDSGIGFAVPADHVQKILLKLKQGEDLHPGVIGISLRAANLSVAEPVIAALHPNSPARKAGLKAGDRILEIDGRKLVRASQLKEELSRRYAGDTIRLVALRDEQRIERELELVAELEPYQRPFLGVLPLRTAPKSEDRAAEVIVRYVYLDGPAAAAGIEPGDALVKLDGALIEGAGDLRARISDRQPEEEVELAVRRGQETLRLKLRLGRQPEQLPPDTLPPAAPPGQAEGEAPAAPAGNERAQAGSIELKIPEFENDAWAYVPEDDNPAVPRGLVVWLEAPGKFDWQETLSRWKPHCDQAGLILLAPEPADPKGWHVREAALVHKLIDQLKSTYTIDPSRVVIHGHRAGGRLAYLVAFSNRGAARAVAAVEAPLSARPPENDPLYPLAFYLAWAKKTRDADRIDAGVTRLRQMKYPVTVKDFGDEPRYLNPDELSELVRWIDMLDRI